MVRRREDMDFGGFAIEGVVVAILRGVDVDGTVVLYYCDISIREDRVGNCPAVDNSGLFCYEEV